MSIIKTNGVILRVSNFGEYDRYLTVLTPKLGAIDILPGRPPNKGGKLRATEVFSVCQFISMSAMKYYLNGVQLVEGFIGLQGCSPFNLCSSFDRCMVDCRAMKMKLFLFMN